MKLTDNVHEVIALDRPPRSWGWAAAIIAFAIGVAFGGMIVEHRRSMQEIAPVTRHEASMTPCEQIAGSLDLFGDCSGRILISAGEWVTHPDGTPVCQVSVAIRPHSEVPTAWLRSLCKDWREPRPVPGMAVDANQFDWLRIENGRQRLHVADRWVP